MCAAFTPTPVSFLVREGEILSQHSLSKHQHPRNLDTWPELPALSKARALGLREKHKLPSMQNTPCKDLSPHVPKQSPEFLGRGGALRQE